MAASKRGRAERLAALEQLIKPPRKPVEDEFAPEQLIKRLGPESLAAGRSVMSGPYTASARRRRSGRHDGKLTVELIEPPPLPAVIRILWPDKPSLCPLVQFDQAVAAAMRILSNAVV